ncbi:hypothetical protein Hdeb2414_s0017g00504071 [Helianthus debilis subsp. tardiflorus]
MEHPMLVRNKYLCEKYGGGVAATAVAVALQRRWWRWWDAGGGMTLKVVSL